MADKDRSPRFPPALIFGAILFIAIAGVAVVLLNYDPAPGPSGEDPPAEQAPRD